MTDPASCLRKHHHRRSAGHLSPSHGPCRAPIRGFGSEQDQSKNTRLRNLLTTSSRVFRVASPESPLAITTSKKLRPPIGKCAIETKTPLLPPDTSRSLRRTPEKPIDLSVFSMTFLSVPIFPVPGVRSRLSLFQNNAAISWPPLVCPDRWDVWQGRMWDHLRDWALGGNGIGIGGCTGSRTRS
jgi:hypothetical protein